MRKFYQNSPYFAELETEMFAPLNMSFAAPRPGPLFMETDDYAGDTSTTGVVALATLPTATSGLIETDGDSDWFAVALLAGQNFEISYLDFELENVSFDIYDSAGILFANTRSLNSFGEEFLGFTADADDTYYVAVTGDPGFTGINYTFFGAVYDDDFSADITTTALMTEGEFFSGVLEAVTDEDWIGIDVTSGELTNILVTTNFMDPNIAIFNAAGEVVTDVTIDLTFDLVGTILSFTPDASERYYVSIQNGFEGFPSNSYSLSTFTDDFSADTSTTGLVSVDGNAVTISGEHETESDVDWFAITLAENQTLEINGFYEFGLSYYDADGNVVPTNGFADDGSGFITSMTATTAGTYFVGVASDVFFAQAYFLSGILYQDDYLASTLTTGILEIDGTASGELQGVTDSDWFAMTLTEGERLTITSDLPGDFTTVLTLRDSAGNFVTSGQPSGDGAGPMEISFDVQTSGTYYVDVGYDFFATPPTTYNLSAISEVPLPDIAGDISTTATIMTGETISSEINDSTDDDWFRFTLSDNEVVKFNLAVDGGGSLLLGIYDAAGTEVLSPTYYNEYIFDVANFGLSAGDYFVSVSGLFDGEPAYDLTATAVEPDIAGDITTTATIAPGETVASELNSDTDSDWFRFMLDAGEAISFSLTTSTGQNLPFSFYDSNGNTLVYNYYASEYTFGSAASGEYYVGISSFYDGTPSYELTATSVLGDIAGDTSTTATIALGETVSSVINSNNDSDWFAFSLTEGQVVDFDWIVEDNRSLDYAVYNEQGNYLFQLTYSEGVFAAPEAGNYFVAVSAYYDGMPTYSLTATELVDDYAANASTTGLIAGGEQLTINFEYATDVDWIKLDGEAGDVLRLTHDDPTLYDFYVVDQSGAIVANNYFGNDFTQIFIDFAIPDDGDYFVRLVSDQYIWSAGQSLTLSAETVIDDFTGGVQTDAVLVAGTTETVRHDFQNDQDWFILDTSQGGDILLSVTPPEYDPFSPYPFGGPMRIHDASGNVIQEFYLDQFASNAFSVSLDAGETYYVSTSLIENVFGLEYSLSSLILTVNGTDGDDTLIGTEIDDTIFGGFGDDTLIGGEGDDALYGSDGDDNLIGGIGADVLNGGNGDDTAIYSTAASGAYINLLTGLGAARSSAQGDTFISIENLVGSAFGDSLTGDDARNEITGGAGDDILNGEGGSDSLLGNDGADVINGGDDSDYISGGQGADMLTGGAGNERFDYNQFGELDGDVITDFALGFDVLDFSSMIYWEGVLPIYIAGDAFTGQRGEIRFEISGNDTLIQLDSDGDGVADETLTLQNYTDALYDAGNGEIFGTSRIIGDENNNTLTGNDFAERFYGMDGNDYIYGNGGDDFVDGGDGFDTIFGGDGHDILNGGNGYDDIYGQDGNDIINGGAGLDEISGGAGNDDLNGGEGTDYLYGDEGDDILRGEAGLNIHYDTDGTNRFVLTGGTNSVTGNSQSVIDFSEASQGAVADLMLFENNAGSAQGDTYLGVDNITGSDFADRLYGDNDANMIIGGDGNDALFGRNGDDIFIGGNGNDLFSGGGGFDTVDYSGEVSAVTADMMGLITASQAALGDRLYSIESVIGTSFNDRIFGNNDGNLIEGGAGNDSLFGRNGNDVINGGEGDDLISAGAHDDVVNGGAGNDRLYTGSGNDTVVMDTAAGGSDTVYDFMTSFDTILIDDDSGNFDSFAEFMTTGVDNGADVTFDFGDGNSLTIKGYNLADLSASDFNFDDVPTSAELIDTELYASDEFTALETFDWGAA